MKNDQKQYNDDYNYDYETTTNYVNLDYQTEQYYYEYDYTYKIMPDVKSKSNKTECPSVLQCPEPLETQGTLRNPKEP